ncbi:MAG: restriction endonuclease subunit S [Bacteroides sp.]|nr:restriction endonuclease subunit S [Bacteroides sp.]MCM1379188.1 restriction endonuclease subunit S [Bacteroides sp.]MCM1445163.1 restriction endonuclease subunit S [Prevotella sp.]
MTNQLPTTTTFRGHTYPLQWKTLGEIGTFYGGLTGKSKQDFSDGNARFISYLNVYSNLSLNQQADEFVKIGENEKQNVIEYGDVLFTGSSETPDECGMSSVVTTRPTEKLYLNSFCFGFRPNDADLFNPDFLKHLLRSEPVRKQIAKTANGVTRFNVSKALFAKIIIPIPDLELQGIIAWILDRFSALTTELQNELQEELAARREQYAYYRNRLLDFGRSNRAQWLPLEEVCKKICSGGTPRTSVREYFDGNIPWLRTQEVDWKDVYDTEIKISDEAVQNSSAKLIPANCVIVAMYGATAAKCCINKIPLTTNQACCNLEIDPEIAYYRYVYHWICGNYLTLKSMGEGSQNNINAAKIKNFLIPIPPLEEQERIVGILDRLEAAYNDLMVSIPAEIAARREQYAYNRNRLLSFRE